MQAFDPFQDKFQFNDHLELDFGKNSLNTTCSSKIILFEQETKSSKKCQNDEIIVKSSKVLVNKQNTTITKKQTTLNRKSRCFMQQMNKVLKQNKIKNSQKSKNAKIDDCQSSYLKNINDISEIHFKTKISTKDSKSNDQIQKMISKDKNKQVFNFEEFLQHMTRKKQSKQNQPIKISQQASNNSRKLQKSKTIVNQSFLDFQGYQNIKIDTKNQIQNQLSQLSKKSKKNIESTVNLTKSRKNNYNISINESILKQRFQNNLNKSRFDTSTVKSSRIMSVKQSRKIEIQKKNHQQNLVLQKSLKDAMINITFTEKTFKNNGELAKTQRLSHSNSKRQFKQEQPKNYAQVIQDIHFDKLKQRVISKMEDYNKIKLIREGQEKDRKKLKKKRTFSVPQKLTLTIQGTNMTIGKNDPQQNNFKGKDFQHRRPFTALSRTGLQYDQRQAYRRRSSQKQYRMTNLAGINNSANHHRTFSKNATRQIQQLDECKSDRVVRKLRQRFTSRPQTAKTSSNGPSRPSTARAIKQNRNSQTLSPRMIFGIEYQKITKKQIQKQKMKQKLLGLLVQCEEEKICNQNLKQGIDIFQDYCDNIQQGLKEITEQIDKYIQKEQ